MARRLGSLMAAASIVTMAGLAQSAEGPGAESVEKRNGARLLKAVTVEGVMRHERAFARIAARNHGTRVSGTRGFGWSASYVKRQLERAGYDVTVQHFPYLFFEETAPPTLARVAPRPRSFTVGTDFFTMFYSGSGSVTGRLVPTNDIQIPPSPEPSSTSGCEPEDFPRPAPPNAIALIQRGTCDFQVKAANAAAAGYAGAVIFNEGQEGRQELLIGTLVSAQPIPVVGATFQLGRDLYLQARQRPVRMSLSVRAFTEERRTRNVIADSRGGRRDRVVLVGAHLDSVAEGPGINDNGSGSAAILEVALQMARLGIPTRNRVRFAFWGAEEAGLFGSAYYVSQLTERQRENIELNLNFDMVGSPNFVRFVYDGDGSATPDEPGDAGPAGSEVIERVFVDYFARRGLATAPTAFDGRSDYGSFIEVGIPAGGLFTGAEGIKTEEEAAIFGGTAGEAYDPCYHQACDDLSNLSRQALDQMSDAIAHSVLAFANRKAPLPAEPATAAAAAATARALDYRGDRLRR